MSDEKLFAIDSTGTAYPLTYDQRTGKYRIRITSIAFFDSNDTPLFDILLKGETYKALVDFSPVYSTNENDYFQGDSQFQMIKRQSKNQTQYRLFLDQAVLEYPTNETAIDLVNMMSNEGLIHFPRDLKDRSLVSDPSRPWLDSYTF